MLLMKTARKCLDEAIRVCKPGMEYGKLGGIIERVATAQGFSTNRDFVGHGVNKHFHCSPDIAVSLLEPADCLQLLTRSPLSSTMPTIVRQGR